MWIALDAMGSDDAPRSEVQGALQALGEDSELGVVLVGDQDAIGSVLRENARSDRIKVHHTPERIGPLESPLAALRRLPRSSISEGLRIHRKGQAQGFVSAGSTGAVMAAARLILGTPALVKRPTIGTPLPTGGGVTLMVDSGANLSCRPRQLLHFAVLGSIYLRRVMNLLEPRVGLLNVGTEPGKGSSVIRAAHRLLEKSKLNFIGNVEGRQILEHACDVLVCDGFVGNVLLKFYESVAAFLRRQLGRAMAPAPLDGRIESYFSTTLNYARQGGAPLLGVRGVCVVGHGASSPEATGNAIGLAARSARSDLASHVSKGLAAYTR